MNKKIQLILFFVLLFASHLFLLKNGTWFYQDVSFWPKNANEALLMLMQQLHAFSNFGYYMGFDNGLFNFTRILVVSYTFILVWLVGNSGSQILFSMSNYIITFISFYIFSGIFFKKQEHRFMLSLFYTFNPLTYNLQTSSYYSAAIPLFIYSFHKYFFIIKRVSFYYLFLNIISAFIWVSYIRFIPMNAFIIIPYLGYFIFYEKKHLFFKKVIVISVVYLLIFSPIFYSLFSQLSEKSETAFNYKNIYGNLQTKENMSIVLNLFQSFVIQWYEKPIWKAIGVGFLAWFIFLVAIFPKRQQSVLLGINLILILTGFTIMGLSNIFGPFFYQYLISFFPFVVNGPLWAFYIVGIPFVVVLGGITEDNPKRLYLFAGLFIVVSLLPLINLADFKVKKFPISSIPQQYKDYFISSYTGIPRPTYYYINKCWRAGFMEEANTPSQCFNFGYHYSPVLDDNPRLISGESYTLSQILYGSTTINNLRITHNVKDVIFPKDIVLNSPNSFYTKNITDNKINVAKKELDNNLFLEKVSDDKFTHYIFKDSNKYDFFIYSPKKMIQKEGSALNDNSLDINDVPVLLPDKQESSIYPVTLTYKVSRLNPTTYALEISNIPKTGNFMIQMNQLYGNSWKLKLTDSSYFDRKKCLSPIVSFPITKNSYCQTSFSSDSLFTSRLVTFPSLPESTHKQSNIMDNGWIVASDSVKKYMTPQGKLYAVIVYEKQIMYSTLIIVSIGTFICILCGIVLQTLIKADE